MNRSLKAVSVPTFRIMMELEIGRRNARELLGALEASNVFLDQEAVAMAAACADPTSQPERVTFGVATVRELGYCREPKWSSVILRMRRLELSLCGVLDALEIGLVYHDQPRLKELFVAMEPVRNSGGIGHILGIGKGWMSERHLCAQAIRPDTTCELEATFVFRLPTQ